MPVNLPIEIKWINSLIDTCYQNWYKNKQSLNDLMSMEKSEFEINHKKTSWPYTFTDEFYEISKEENFN